MLNQIFLALGWGWFRPESIFLWYVLSLRCCPTLLLHMNEFGKVCSLGVVKLPLLLVRPESGSEHQFLLLELRYLLLKKLVLSQQLIVGLPVVVSLVQLPLELVTLRLTLRLGDAHRLGFIITF